MIVKKRCLSGEGRTKTPGSKRTRRATVADGAPVLAVLCDRTRTVTPPISLDEVTLAHAGGFLCAVFGEHLNRGAENCNQCQERKCDSGEAHRGGFSSRGFRDLL